MRRDVLLVGIVLIVGSVIGSSAALYAAGSDLTPYLGMFFLSGCLFLVGIVVAVIGAILAAKGKQCPTCGQLCPPGQRFCTRDGTSLELDVSKP